MEKRPIKLDEVVKISAIVGSFIIALSVAYYLVVFLPKQESVKMEEQKQQETTQAAQEAATQAITEQNEQTVNQQVATPTEDPQIKIEKCKITAQQEAQAQTAVHGPKIPSLDEGMKALAECDSQVNSEEVSFCQQTTNDAYQSEYTSIENQDKAMMAEYYNQFYYQCLSN